MSNRHDPGNLNAALLYAARGWPVFPVYSIVDGRCTCRKAKCDKPGKHPRTKSGHLDATTDEAILRDWWKRWPNANIGVRTGTSSGIVAVDVDTRDGGDATLAALVAKHGPLPETVEASSGSGGRHLLFLYPAGEEIRNDIGTKLGIGIDVRGEGGYLIVEPSRHISGGTYRWKQGHSPEDRSPAALPAWILGLVRKPLSDRKRENGQRNQAIDTDRLATLISAATTYVTRASGVREGQRNAAAFNLAGHLAAFELEVTGGRLTETQILDLVRTWNHRNDPPLSDDELSQAVHSATVNGTPRSPHSVRNHSRTTPGKPGDDTLSSLRSLSSHSFPKPMDEAAFYGLAGETVRKIEPHTEADPVALLVDFLVSFGSATGRSAYFVADGAWHYSNLFGVLVGNTSKGRKGTSHAQVERLLETADRQWVEERVQGGLSSGEGLIWAVRDQIMKKEPIKQKGKVTEYQDVIADPGVDDKRLLLMEGEFAGVLRVLGREGNTLSAIMRQAWDKGRLRTLTKNSPAKASGAHISIIGHITRDELRRYLNCTEAGNGFGNRFLWICVRRSKCLPDGGQIHTVDFSDILRRLSKSLQFGAGEREIKRDEKARAIWHEVYSDLSEGRPGLFGALTSRSEAQVMRLALIYALLDCSPVIQAEHLMAGLAVWEYAEASVRHIFGDAIGDPIADELLRALRAAGPAGMTRTEIRDLFKRHKGAEQINRALAVLEDEGLARCERVTTDGRSSERWSIATAT